MTTEWLALWCPFLVFGGLTMVFCMICWKHIGTLLIPVTQHDNGVPSAAQETTKQRRRLLRIAAMVSICLLLNTIATLLVSSKLGEWSRTADLSLTCSIKETWNSRDWEACGFNAKDIVNVCGAEETTMHEDCESDCQWLPSLNQNYLTCDEKRGVITCKCPCSSFVEVERPSVGTLTLAHVSQSLVVAIVGLNLGFRFEGQTYCTFIHCHNDYVLVATHLMLLHSTHQTT
jgi:hypothetical protein